MSTAIKQDLSLSLDQKLITRCEEAVQETFLTLMGVRPRLLNVVHNPNKRTVSEISGVIGIVQNSMEGTISLGFSQEALKRMMTDFYQQPVDNMDDNLIGGISELTNIIFGMIKENYSNDGHQFKMCLPIVVVGNNHSVFSALSADGVILYFSTDYGPFTLEVMSVKKV